MTYTVRWENATSRHMRAFHEFIDMQVNKDDDEPFFYQHAFTHVHIPWVPSRFFVTDPVLKHFTGECQLAYYGRLSS